MIDPQQARAILAAADIIHAADDGRRRGWSCRVRNQPKDCATAIRCCCA
jgi:hypothetical protein